MAKVDLQCGWEIVFKARSPEECSNWTLLEMKTASCHPQSLVSFLHSPFFSLKRVKSCPLWSQPGLQWKGRIPPPRIPEGQQLSRRAKSWGIMCLFTVWTPKPRLCLSPAAWPSHANVQMLLRQAGSCAFSTTNLMPTGWNALFQSLQGELRTSATTQPKGVGEA